MFFKKRILKKNINLLNKEINLYKGFQEEQIDMFEKGLISTDTFNRVMLDDDIAIDNLNKEKYRLEQELKK